MRGWTAISLRRTTKDKLKKINELMEGPDDWDSIMTEVVNYILESEKISLDELNTLENFEK